MGRIYRAIERAQIFDKYGPFIVFEADVLAPIERRRSSVDVAGFEATHAALVNAAARGIDVGAIGERLRTRKERFTQYVEVAESRKHSLVRPDNLRIAPQQILATAETSWLSRAYPEHEALMVQMARTDEMLFARLASTHVELGDAVREGEAIASWERAHDAEALVVKPLEYPHRGRLGLVLPAVEVRTAEALRLIYGPEFDVAENLGRLRKRSLSALRYRALSQHALGMEALVRFVEREPLSRVHVCICAALALECESAEPIT
jgi:protein phosphatase